MQTEGFSKKTFSPFSFFLNKLDVGRKKASKLPGQCGCFKEMKKIRSKSEELWALRLSRPNSNLAFPIISSRSFLITVLSSQLLTLLLDRKLFLFLLFQKMTGEGFIRLF